VDYLGKNPKGYNARQIVKVAEDLGYNASIQEGPPKKYDIIIIDDGILDMGYPCYDENPYQNI